MTGIGGILGDDHRGRRKRYADLLTATLGVRYSAEDYLFEMLPVGPTVRKALSSGPTLEVLRQAARKDGMRTLQEEGILLVAKGVTSLPELMRVLKQ